MRECVCACSERGRGVVVASQSAYKSHPCTPVFVIELVLDLKKEGVAAPEEIVCLVSCSSSLPPFRELRARPAATTVDMAAVCHFDTSKWDLAHPAFKILHTHPGGSPVCHFLPYADLIFGEKADNNA